MDLSIPASRLVSLQPAVVVLVVALPFEAILAQVRVSSSVGPAAAAEIVPVAALAAEAALVVVPVAPAASWLVVVDCCTSHTRVGRR